MLNNLLQLRAFIIAGFIKLHVLNIYRVHIRRTDKSREAAYQPIERYMWFVEDYLNNTQKTKDRPQIYLASDEPTIPTEVQKG